MKKKTARQTPAKTHVIDCGVGLFSMHAPMGLAGKLDLYLAYKGYLAFLNDSRK